MPDVPPRQPISDVFSGVLLRHATAHLLAYQPVDDLEVVATGDFVLRYGVRYLEKPHLSLIPELLAVDYGDFFNGEAMWDFMLTRHNGYPRAEAFGHRNDGKDDMIVLKRLDFAAPKQVLAFSGAEASEPIAAVDALLTPDANDLPSRLLDYLPTYPTFDDWIRRE